ncbi:CHAP domain-containing protein [Kitasatospora sp. LaBMicrA B282]|uniref:CHAP domain-containing protein n=1 Tax=Kitasatospora sp. LaBMicrA B282 TaxID=3420949 RepID=UPI003D09C030
MFVTRLLRRTSGAAVVLLLAGLVTLLPAGSATAAAGGDAAALAAANVGKTAGTCANAPTYNSLGGSQFETSCSGGYSGGPEYWCADFAEWVWQHSGFATNGLTAAAASFYTYGQNNGTLHTATSYRPQPGDAVEYGSIYDSEIHHVAIVTSVNGDGSVTTANGDWNGTTGTGSMAGFAVSSSVVSITIPAGQTAVGTEPSTVDPGDGYYIVGYTTPVASGSGNNPPPVAGGNPYSPNAVCGTGFGVIDSHALAGATVFLLYNSATGQNCVTTLVTNPAGPVPLNATLAVQGGSSGSNPGSFTYYAGPVTESAPSACVQWGGSYQGTSWTSGWSHCGGGAGAPGPVGSNIYTPAQVCGSGYGVIDSHDLGAATVYLLYDGSTGDNCVTTLAHSPSGPTPMNATLAVQGGSSGSNPGSFTYYAGPVTGYAPNACVQWGGSYQGTSWTSSWSHCGTGSPTPSPATGNPYSAGQVCGTGYTVIDSHSLGDATVYLLYDAADGNNCVVTLAADPSGPTPMNATLTVQGGSALANPGSFTYYAGPVTATAANTCVEWGGSYKGTSWTSGWSHCG